MQYSRWSGDIYCKDGPKVGKYMLWYRWVSYMQQEIGGY